MRAAQTQGVLALDGDAGKMIMLLPLTLLEPNKGSIVSVKVAEKLVKFESAPYLPLKSPTAYWSSVKWAFEIFGVGVRNGLNSEPRAEQAEKEPQG